MGCSALVAGYLHGNILTCRELEDVFWVRWVAKMVVEPPFVERQVYEGNDGAVVVGERLGGDVVPEHGRVPDGCQKLAEIVKGKKIRTSMAVDEAEEEKECDKVHCWSCQRTRTRTGKGCALLSIAVQFKDRRQ